MRAEEDEALLKCRATIKTMKSDMLRQEKTGIEVKNGVFELDKLFDIIRSQCQYWTKVEKDTRCTNAAKCTKRTDVSMLFINGLHSAK